jgi:hypothetical protein
MVLTDVPYQKPLSANIMLLNASGTTKKKKLFRVGRVDVWSTAFWASKLIGGEKPFEGCAATFSGNPHLLKMWRDS